jgi:predicted metal-dependent HD superfamily phosphohydrolase
MILPEKDYPITINSEIFEKVIFQYYETFGRSYHKNTHILKMLVGLRQLSDLTHEELHMLELAILFHDAGETEEKSCQIFSEWFPGDPNTEIVHNMIMATKDHDYTKAGKLTRIILDLDLAILHAPMKEMLDYEHGIFKQIVFHTFNKLGAQKMMEVLPEASYIPGAWAVVPPYNRKYRVKT